MSCYDSYEKMSDHAAQIVAGEIIKNPGLVLGLPTGSTPLGMYLRLAEQNKAGKIDFSGVTTFNLDEYYPIKKTSPQSYHSFMFENFFGKINIDKKNINIPDGEAMDPDLECMEYDKKISRAKKIDLMVLGMGPNGHIGFNEPDSFLVPHTHVAELTDETIEANKRFFDSIDEVPKRALTMGMGSIIAKSKKILLLVSGESKTAAFRQFLERKITPKNPSTFLYLHDDVVILSDIGQFVDLY